MLALAPVAAGAQQADTHAIVGARVITVSGPVYDSATLVMRDGLIEAVGPDVAPPPGARVIDGKGLTVTPGLIDGFGGVGLPAPARGGSGAASGAPSGAPSPQPLAPAGAGARPRARGGRAEGARQRHHHRARDPEGGRAARAERAAEPRRATRAEAMVLRQPAALHLHMATLPRASTRAR